MFDRTDLKERFLTYETAKGIYLIAGAIAITLTMLFYIQYSTYVMYGIIAQYMLSEGLRKVFVNRIKQAAVRETLIARRLVHDSDTRKS